MTPELVVDVFRQAVSIVLIVTMVLILPGLAVGLLVAMFQAATQINEMSLSFIPKLVVTLTMLTVAGPWILRMLVAFAEKLIRDIPYMIG